MKARDGLALALLAHATQTLAQYVTTVTVSVNSNPFCTPVSSNRSSEGSAGGVSGSGSGSGPGVSIGYGNGTGSTASGSLSAAPIDTATGRYAPLAYYAVPIGGNLLGGPLSINSLMTVELCGNTCQGYSYLALEKGDECNCGSTAPSGTAFSAPPPLKKRHVTSGTCIPCVGNSAECCGAPGGYALVYHLTSDVEGSSVVVFSTINSAGSVVQVSSTSYFPISLGSVVTYTSTASDGSVIVGSTTTYTAAATSVDSIINSANSVNVRTTGSYAQSSPSTYPYSTAESAGAAIFPMPSAPSPTGSDSGPSSNSAGGSNSGSGSTGSSLSSAGSVGSGTTSSTSSSSSVSSYFVYTSPNTIVTSNTMILGASDTGTTDSASPTISANGVKSDATGAVAGGSSIGATGTGGGTATTNGGATGPEPTSSSAPSCVSAAGYAGNNTKYQDIFGYTYDIRCNLNLDSMPTDNNAHAETFNDCLNYCDLLTGCVAVNYQDAPSKPNNLSNCYPKWSFGGYSPSDPPTDGVYSGVNVNGASPGFSPQDLCTTNNNQGSSYDGQEWYDDYGTPWNIGCDTLIPISSTAALATTVTDTLAACVDYCSTYDSCVMVNWLGPHTNGTASDANCFPASSIGAPGAAGSSPGLGYATLASDSS